MHKSALLPSIIISISFISSCGISKDQYISPTPPNSGTGIISHSSDEKSAQSLEIQEEQKSIGNAFLKIENPDYKKLIKNRSDIYQGKEIWTDEMKEVNREFEGVLSRMITSSGKDMSEFTKIQTKKADIMKTFDDSEEYKKYMLENRGKLTMIDEAMRQLEISEAVK